MPLRMLVSPHAQIDSGYPAGRQASATKRRKHPPQSRLLDRGVYPKS